MQNANMGLIEVCSHKFDAVCSIVQKVAVDLRK